MAASETGMSFQSRPYRLSLGSMAVMSNDQPGVAARIAYTKTGTFVPLKELTVPRLTLLIDRVLRNPEYRENADRLRQVIADTNGLEKAVDLLEKALGLERPL
jgi:zeaxanthin glucosyltransferase